MTKELDALETWCKESYPREAALVLRCIAQARKVAQAERLLSDCAMPDCREQAIYHAPQRCETHKDIPALPVLVEKVAALEAALRDLDGALKNEKLVKEIVVRNQEGTIREQRDKLAAQAALLGECAKLANSVVAGHPCYEFALILLGKLPKPEDER